MYGKVGAFLWYNSTIIGGTWLMWIHFYLSANNSEGFHILPPGWAQHASFSPTSTKHAKKRSVFEKMAGIVTRGMMDSVIFSMADFP